MSDPEDTRSAEPTASVITRRAADWVSVKRGPGNWSQEQQADLDAWLQLSLTHRVAYLRVDAAWGRAERLAALRTSMRPPPVKRDVQPSFWRRISVFLGLAVLLGVFASQLVQTPSSQLIETPKGGQERVVLADGSQVELNTDTSIAVDFRSDSRSVRLNRGEAFFLVKHNGHRPFSVTAGNRRIVDLGTKFAVRMAPHELKVSLLEGRASLEGVGGYAPRPIVLSPGDVAIATAETTRVSRESSHSMQESLAWRRGSVVFHYEKLGDVVAELNRYGGPRLVVADGRTANLLISGTFLTNRPEDFAGVAHEIFGVRIEHRNGQLVLSR